MTELDLQALEAGGARVYSVGELVFELRRSLESTFPPLLVEGEISNFSQQSSGHLYFTLKDGESQLRCVCFRTDALRLGFVPRDGECLVLFGRCTVYPRTGALQMVVGRAFKRGAGHAAEALEVLRRKLQEEGLFALERKRPIPFFASTIGIVTSRSGAAVFDILSILRRRAPCAQVFFLSARVQGERAGWEIAEAIDFINAWFPIEVLIVGRGGGSLEDLGPFNEEVVARAVSRSRVPVISAVGHEVDVTICDQVADRRAATPSEAAELAVPDSVALRRNLDAGALRLREAESRLRGRLTSRLDGFIGRYGLRAVRRRIADETQFLGDLSARLERAVHQDLAAVEASLREKSGRLEALSPLATLARGYAIVERLPGRRVVRRGGDLSPGDRLRLRFAEGEALAAVTESETPASDGGARGEAARRQRRTPDAARELQRTLFTNEHDGRG